MRKGLLIAAVIAIGAIAFGVRWRFRAPPPPPSALSPRASRPAGPSAKAFIAYADAATILDAHRSTLPIGLKGVAPAALQAAWPAWVSRHDAEIRSRLAQGDEDSLVNLWLYGTSFTAAPRATEQEMALLPTRAAAEQLLVRRLDDLVTRLAAPGDNERLQFARQVVAAHDIDVSTDAGQERARIYLVKARDRVIAEQARYRRVTASAKRPGDAAGELDADATLYRDRGLSSDTQLTADFALDSALSAIASSGSLAPRSVHRAALAGPGLDFIDKAEGYDFYPLQTIQPFALIDSLRRANLAVAEGLRVTTFDLSPRVNEHLAGARRRAAAGEVYTIQLPLATGDPKHQWEAPLLRYWQAAGDQIGDDAAAILPPAVTGAVRVRAVRIRPSVTLSIVPQDLDIITERLEPLADEERFDLVVATNLLVYYDAFDQALALSNIAGMLRPGGLFVTNSAVSPGESFEAAPVLVTPVFFDRQQNRDTLFSYRKK